ncbi:hypothetical protein DPMN_025727 [Dreissena polymorpha]|uniref:Uncharacterized protein n=1 Tax=Dreissena polymorpha TaxID=45954 RepID=A0A9D4RC35_DREPO|nr:hypothetical protein DPMN_025727 [Dreissena polymorpha]
MRFKETMPIMPAKTPYGNLQIRRKGQPDEKRRDCIAGNSRTSFMHEPSRQGCIVKNCHSNRIVCESTD